MRPSEELAKYAIHVLALAQMLLLGSLSLSFFLSVFQLCAVLLAANLPAAN